MAPCGLALGRGGRPAKLAHVVVEDHAVHRTGRRADDVGWRGDLERGVDDAGLDGALGRGLSKALLLLRRQYADRGRPGSTAHLLERVQRVSVAVDRVDLVAPAATPQDHRHEGDDQDDDEKADDGSHLVK